MNDEKQGFTVDVEYTDTFSGEANYSWVKRATLTLPPGTSDREVIRRAKAAVGLTGVPCKRTCYGDMVDLRPRGTLTVLFIVWRA